MSDHAPLADATEEELAAALAIVRSRRQHAAEETIFVRGEGGAVFEMAPSRMTAETRRRMQMGRLRRVNADGSPYRAHALVSETPSAPAGGSALTDGRVPRPAKSAPKKDWVLYAVAALGLDEERALEMTRQELIDLPPDHAQHPDTVPDGDDPPAPAGGRPAEDAPKKAWIDHVARLGLLSREDAAVYTKDDLIAMVS
ncbi:hypothetical protein [Streptomyces apocyni]|uniref:hypothetical protein n=1 Tax=Streptomyces apocyni TaxID=2654677 RepID=UPI0012EA5CD5|nr:hypothetical protein [Streptomyces apocyni]